jgi:predicted nucleic acid-binding protein
MNETVYIETSMIGYLTARPCNNLIVMANQQVTREWWENRRRHFDLYISEIVLDEAAQGDREIAAQRLDILAALPLLEINEAVRDLARQFLAKSNLPAFAANDSLHMAAATFYGLDYLLTWNCKHIANAQIQKKLSQISLDAGYDLPTITTPLEMMGA